MMHFCTYIVLVIILTGILCEEPQCSKFHYEAQTLEKMIRMEINQEVMEKEIMKTNQLVLESLQALKNERKDLAKDYTVVTRNLLDESDKLKKDFKDLKSRIFEENEKLIKNYVELKNNLSAESNAIKDTPLTPTITFKARGVTNLKLTQGQTIIFSTIMLNDGGAYDSTTGIFTAPISGTYLFTTQLCAGAGKSLYYGIVFNNVDATSGYIYNSGAQTCYSADAILNMTSGQKEWVKCTYGSGELFETNNALPSWNHWNTFSGTIIHK